jgi:hypothetical protein
MNYSINVSQYGKFLFRTQSDHDYDRVRETVELLSVRLPQAKIEVIKDPSTCTIVSAERFLGDAE